MLMRVPARHIERLRGESEGKGGADALFSSVSSHFRSPSALELLLSSSPQSQFSAQSPSSRCLSPVFLLLSREILMLNQSRGSAGDEGKGGQHLYLNRSSPQSQAHICIIQF